MTAKPKYCVGLSVLVAAYISWSQFALWLVPILQPRALPIWSPTGIGLAVVIIFGYRYWPGILVGEVVLATTLGIPMNAALGIGVGDTVEAMLGAYLLQRLKFDRRLTRLSDVWAFVTLAVLASPILGATIATMSLQWSQVAGLRPLTEVWWTWWIGDAMGVLLVAPMVLTWVSPSIRGWEWRQFIEVGVLGSVLMLLWILVFGGLVAPPIRYPLEYLFFPLVVWPAIRLGQPGSTLTIFVATAIILWDWSNGLGLIAAKGSLDSLLELQGFLGVLSVTGMALAAAINERLTAEKARDSAVLSERDRMARDIHDTLAQGFTGILMQLQAAEDVLAKDDTRTAQSHINRACELARSSLAEARRSVMALRPRALENAPLVEAIQHMVRKLTNGTDIRAEVLVLGKPQSLPPRWDEELLRIAQEALTNTLKHANASQFEVKLAYEAKAMQMRIRDDGVGFDPGLPNDGFGLVGMRERAERMNGQLSLVSSPGHGTEIRVVLPLVQAEREAA
jgi:signal transduction histidine kinase